ncbi:MAG: hypothetical protein PW843_15660 [Azospirillaceae bacterium]|nr:hypothetical protein [Azospirillaceae bacterium]
MRFKSLFLASALLFTGVAVAKAEEPVGARYFTQIMPVNGSATVFTAASNVNGAIIRTTAIWTTANGLIHLVASYPDGSQRILFTNLATPAQNSSDNLGFSLRLPAGVGLLIVSSGGASGYGAGGAAITYDLL